MDELATVLTLETLRGWYVYKLYGADGEIIYIGRSSNICLRIGQHVAKFRERITRVEIERVATLDAAHALEGDLIDRWQPQYNTHGKRGQAPVRREGTCVHPKERNGACIYGCRFGSDLSRTQGHDQKE